MFFDRIFKNGIGFWIKYIHEKKESKSFIDEHFAYLKFCWKYFLLPKDKFNIFPLFPTSLLYKFFLKYLYTKNFQFMLVEKKSCRTENFNIIYISRVVIGSVTFLKSFTYYEAFKCWVFDPLLRLSYNLRPSPLSFFLPIVQKCNKWTINRVLIHPARGKSLKNHQIYRCLCSNSDH